MPRAQVGDIGIYYEIHGDAAGPPLLLIPGLSNDITDYAGPRGILAALAAQRRVLIFDPRGAGRSDKPDIPYTIPMLADDAAGLLAALGIARADVCGVSMGGRVALALALDHPALVRSLILVSTGATVRPTLMRGVLGLVTRLPGLRGSRQYPQPAYAYARQRAASGAYDATARLPAIQVPTLILHGRQDHVAPYDLAEALHAGIAGSRLVPFPGGHIFLFLHPARLRRRGARLPRRAAAGGLRPRAGPAGRCPAAQAAGNNHEAPCGGWDGGATAGGARGGGALPSS